MLNKLIPKFVMRVLIENFPGVEEEGDKEKENKGTDGQVGP